MADIQIVMEVLGNEGIISATKSTVKLENTIKSLSKSLDAGRISDQQFNTALKELRRTLDNNGKSWQANKAFIDRYVDGLRQAEQAQERSRSAQERLNQARKRSATVLALQEQRLREEAAAQKVAAAAAKQQEATLDRLRHKYIQGHTAMELYSKEMNDLAIARKAGIISAAQQSAAVERLNNDYAKGIGVFSRFNQAQMAATKGSNQLGVVTQQAGYQIGDFLVQVQSGTNPLVAFGQQATQLVGILPLLGPSLGISTGALIGLSTALGIGIPLVTAIGAAFMRTSGSAEKATDSVSKITGALRDYRSYAETASATTADLQGEFGQFADQVRYTAELLAGAAISRAFDNLNTGPLLDIGSALDDAVDSYNVLIKTQTLFNTQVTKPGVKLAITPETMLELGKEAKDAAAELGLLPQQAADFNNMLDKLQNSSSLVEIRDNSQSILDYFASIYKEGERIPAPIARALEEIGKMRSAAARVVTSVDDITSAVSRTHKAYIPLTAEQTSFQKAVDDSVNNFISLQENTQAIKEEIGQAAFEALRLGGVDMASGVDAAAKAAAKLAADLNISLAAAMQMQAMASKEEAVMSQPVVQGSALDRYDVETLLGMGYTKEYLTAMGKIKGDRKGGAAGGAPKEDFSSYMASLEEELKLKNRLVGMTEEQKTSAQRYFDIEQKALDIIARKEGKTRDLTPVEEERIQKLVEEEAALRRVTEAEQKRKSMMETIEGHITNGFMAMIDGSSSVEDAFKGMLRNILLAIYRQQVAEPAAEGIGNLLRKGAMAIFGGGQTTASAYGNVFQNGSVKAFADGGIVSSPTFFPMSNGTGLMGEAGPEAIMPLKRGLNGKLGVEASGGQQVVVNQSFNFAANGDESVKKIIAQAAPQIAQMTQKQIMDSRRRGGQMKAAFS